MDARIRRDLNEAVDGYLGEKMRDSATGFEGTCTGVAVYQGSILVRLEWVAEQGPAEGWYEFDRIERAPGGPSIPDGGDIDL